MPATSIMELLDLYQFPPGRRIYAARQVKDIAIEIDHAVIEVRADRVIIHDQMTLRKVRKWKHSRTVQEGTRDESTHISDRKTDRSLGAIYRNTGEWLINFEEISPKAQRVKQFYNVFFPEGLRALTTLPYEEKLVHSQDFVDQINGPYKDVRDAVGLGQYTDHLEEVLDDYEAALRRNRTRSVDFGQVRAANAEGEDLFARLIVKILGDFSELDEQDREMRNRLMAPILDQDERIGEEHRRRTKPRDVDPVTGEEVPEEPLPVDEDSPQPVDPQPSPTE